jgi:hypothetical protein
MCCSTREFWITRAAPFGLAAALSLASLPLHAGDAGDRNGPDATAAIGAPSASDDEPFPARTIVRALIEKEVATKPASAPSMRGSKRNGGALRHDDRPGRPPVDKCG